MHRTLPLLIVIALISILFGCNDSLSSKFNGPGEASVPITGHPSSWKKYDNDNSGTLAILLDDTNANWLGLAHAFKSFGIPFTLTTDLNKALKHHVVLVYPIASYRLLSPNQMTKLTQYADNGGTLIATSVISGLLNLFGLKDALPSSTRFSATLTDTSDSLFTQFTEPEERTLSFGNKKAFKTIFSTLGYTVTNSQPLMQYDDGTALLTYKKEGTGRVYAFGLDLGLFFQRCYTGHGFNPERSYDDGFEPTLDVLVRTIKTIYTQSAPLPVTIGTVPYNKSFTLAITHDIDYLLSIENAVTYAEMEKENNIRCTYFDQVKYIKDYNDDIFFNRKGIKYLNKIYADSMEIGSHTVCHSREFAHFDYGTGKESYPSYHPFVRNKDTTKGATIMGELRVSKYLIETALDNKEKVLSFRAGYLGDPPALPQALLSAGYTACSNATANSCLTHLPFQLNYNRGFDEEMNIFEYPVTIEDEALPPLNERVPQSLALINKISRYGGFVCILIHPNVVAGKFEFEKRIIAAVKDKAYFTTIHDFNLWWKARNEITVSVSKTKSDTALIINAPMAIHGACINIPTGWKLKTTEPGINQTGNTLIFDELNGQKKVSLIYGHCIYPGVNSHSTSH